MQLERSTRSDIARSDRGRRGHRRVACALLVVGSGVWGTGTAPPAGATTTWSCAGTTEYFVNSWTSLDSDPKYNTSRFHHRHCNTYSPAGITAWQFVAVETKASRGCGGVDRWRVRNHQFLNSVLTATTPESSWHYNDCLEESNGVVDTLGEVFSGSSTASLQAAVTQRCDNPGTPPLNCATFTARSSKLLDP